MISKWTNLWWKSRNFGKWTRSSLPECSNWQKKRKADFERRYLKNYLSYGADYGLIRFSRSFSTGKAIIRVNFCRFLALSAVRRWLGDYLVLKSLVGKRKFSFGLLKIWKYSHRLTRFLNERICGGNREILENGDVVAYRSAPIGNKSGELTLSADISKTICSIGLIMVSFDSACHFLLEKR